jgi:FkbM family methyltransferase
LKEVATSTVMKNSLQRWLFENHWRVKRFLPDRYFRFRFPGGRIYLNLKRHRGMLSRAFGMYEPAKMEAVLKLLRPGSIFLDVGANIGDFSLLAASVTGSAGKVLAFEPEATNCYWIKRNIELNGYKNIEVFQLALSDRDGEASLYLGDRCDYHSLLKGQPERQAGIIAVKIRTLDSFLEELGQDRVDMIKVDVEGAELEVLRGARETLRRNPDIVLLLELHPLMGVNPAEVCDFLRDMGLSLFQMSSQFNAPARVHEKLSEVLVCRHPPASRWRGEAAA